jgi:hypothetical protein
MAQRFFLQKRFGSDARGCNPKAIDPVLGGSHDPSLAATKEPNASPITEADMLGHRDPGR